MAKRVSRPGFQASIVWGLLPGWQRWVQLPGVKGSRAGEEMIDSRALGSARTAPCLYIPGSKGKARALPWGWRWKEMLEGNEKNLLAKFAIMDTSPGGIEASPSGHREWPEVGPRSQESKHFWGTSEAPAGGNASAHTHPLSSLFFSFFHFVLRCGLVHLKQMHLWPPFKFSILMVPWGFQKPSLLRLFNWRLTEPETRQHLGKQGALQADVNV